MNPLRAAIDLVELLLARRRRKIRLAPARVRGGKTRWWRRWRRIRPIEVPQVARAPKPNPTAYSELELEQRWHRVVSTRAYTGIVVAGPTCGGAWSITRDS